MSNEKWVNWALPAGLGAILGMGFAMREMACVVGVCHNRQIRVE